MRSVAGFRAVKCNILCMLPDSNIVIYCNVPSGPARGRVMHVPQRNSRVSRVRNSRVSRLSRVRNGSVAEPESEGLAELGRIAGHVDPTANSGATWRSNSGPGSDTILMVTYLHATSLGLMTAVHWSIPGY